VGCDMEMMWGWHSEVSARTTISWRSTYLIPYYLTSPHLLYDTHHDVESNIGLTFRTYIHAYIHAFCAWMNAHTPISPHLISSHSLI
jgi:hypothetical protein